MTPVQVCALLAAVLLGCCWGAPLAPAGQAARPLHRLIEQQRQNQNQEASSWLDPQSHFPEFGVKLGVTSERPEYDYYVYEYDDYTQLYDEVATSGFDESAPVAALKLETAGVVRETHHQPAARQQQRESESSATRLSGINGRGRVVSVSASRAPAVTELPQANRLPNNAEKMTTTPSTSLTTEGTAAKPTASTARAAQTTTAAPTTTRAVTTATAEAKMDTAAKSKAAMSRATTSATMTRITTTTTTTMRIRSSTTKETPVKGILNDPTQSADLSSAALAYLAADVDATEGLSNNEAVRFREDIESNRVDVEHQVSESARVITYHLQDLQHPRVTKSPRDVPEFFIPPIQRNPARRRVSLTQQNRPQEGPSLGDLLAEQVRKQLAQLQAEDAAAQSQPTTEEGKSTASPSLPAAYKHPFIPSPPTTTKEPYKHPFIPSPPTTTKEPYRPPFIPTPPSTTSKPYKHPHIPTPPTTTSVPYVHPHIPVPPETTREPEQRVPENYELPESVHVSTNGRVHGPVGRLQVAPQPRRIPDATVPRIHLPPSKQTQPQSGSTPAPSAPAPATTIVHQETLEEGFIVGEYGEVSGGGQVRGVKYAADSSVDRSLLEAALKQFLQL